MTDFRRFPLALALLALALAGSSVPAAAQSDRDPGLIPGPMPRASRADARDGMSAEMMYRLLVGDIALQRGEPGLAARAYYEAARDLRDPKLARRATEIGLAARQRALALESARLWSELEPEAERPKQVIASLSAGGTGKGLDAGTGSLDLKLEIERVLADSAAAGQPPGDVFLQLNRLLAHEPDRMATFRLVSSLAQPYPIQPEAHFAMALAAFNTGLTDVATAASAMQSIDRALALKPGWERAALLKSEILGKRSTDEAVLYLTEFLHAQPSSRAAAAALAQFLVEKKRYAEARAVFEKLWNEDRSNLEYRFAMAALSVQMKDWVAAEALFDELKRAEYGEAGAVEIYLAQIAEETGRWQLAYERYLAVPDGERAWLAKLRAAAMLAKQGRVAEARRYLADLPAVTIEQRVQVRQAEAQLLRDAGDNTGAYAVLTQALVEQPDQPDLLYDLAMVAEKLDRIDVVEARLARLIELKPDNPHALNALGYTLVDRTKRLDEGFALIERAHNLSPDDPFILDSMGWALFRQGRLDDAEKFLRRAMTERPDAEIAAHLGEVLWAKGERGPAQELWQSQLKAAPDNAVLLETMRRLAR
ncbi:MAG: tetratricopeptide repeat protein [Betaproteobacteria bacterium]